MTLIQLCFSQPPALPEVCTGLSPLLGSQEPRGRRLPQHGSVQSLEIRFRVVEMIASEGEAGRGSGQTGSGRVPWWQHVRWWPRARGAMLGPLESTARLRWALTGVAEQQGHRTASLTHCCSSFSLRYRSVHGSWSWSFVGTRLSLPFPTASLVTAQPFSPWSRFCTHPPCGSD